MTVQEKTLRTTPINLAQVASVYSGRPGCCCGCKGKHTYAKAYQAQQSKRRGYPVTDDEVRDATVSLIVRKINAAIIAGQEVRDEGGHVFLDLGRRWYIAYFAKETT